MEDQAPKSSSKYKRFVFEVEVEVTDPVAAKAYNMNLVRGPDGPEMMQSAGVDSEIKQAVLSVMSHALYEKDRPGFRALTVSSPINRSTDANGNYPRAVLPAMPGRYEDGSMKRIYS